MAADEAEHDEKEAHRLAEEARREAAMLEMEQSKRFQHKGGRSNQLDTDGDGKISKEEFRNARSAKATVEVNVHDESDDDSLKVQLV